VNSADLRVGAVFISGPVVRQISLLLAILFLGAAGPAALPPATAAIDALPENLASVVQKASSSVVSIAVVRDNPGDERQGRSHGSGFVIDPSGLVVTNNHVIEGAREIYVSLPDATRRVARLVGRDRRSDLALLQVTTDRRLAALAVGDSDVLRTGEWVIAIGNPFGLGGSASAGIVSARNRQIDAESREDFIQTDAAINRGSSGGPLLNLKGEVVGVNSALMSPNGGSSGVSFAIPANTLRFVVSRLRKQGSVQRGWIGAKVLDLTPDLALAFEAPSAAGALIGDVVPAGPAARAGFVPGDIVTHLGEARIPDSRDFQRRIAESESGKQVVATVLRRRAVLQLPITVGARADDSDVRASPVPLAGNEAQRVLGMALEELSPATRRRLALGQATEGLLVGGVSGGSVSAEADIRAGDLVLEVERQPATSARKVKGLLTLARGTGKKFVLVTVQRGGGTLFKALRIPEQRLDTALVLPAR
jgi:serine protease Do